jgi:hypothetical protein
VATHSPSRERQWFIVGRWQEFEGEGRANLLRVVGIALFYAIELINYHGLHLGFLEMAKVVDRPFHMTVTGLAVAWTLLALGVRLCLQLRVFPAALKFITTAADLLFLTTILLVADGPRSPLVVGYLVILALAALRLNLPLIRFATAGAVVCYLALLGNARWLATTDLRVPRYQQLIFLLAVVLTGIVLGQVIRRVRQVAEDYARRAPLNPPGSP